MIHSTVKVECLRVELIIVSRAMKWINNLNENAIFNDKTGQQRSSNADNKMSTDKTDEKKKL